MPPTYTSANMPPIVDYLFTRRVGIASFGARGVGRGGQHQMGLAGLPHEHAGKIFSRFHEIRRNLVALFGCGER